MGYLNTLMHALLWPRNALAASLTNYLHGYAYPVADVVICLMGATAVYCLLRIGSRRLERLVYYTIIGLWILVAAVAIIARVVGGAP